MVVGGKSRGFEPGKGLAGEDAEGGVGGHAGGGDGGDGGDGLSNFGFGQCLHPFSNPAFNILQHSAFSGTSPASSLKGLLAKITFSVS